MQTKNLPHLALVRATWIDSQHTNGWVPMSEVPEAAPIVSVGFVIKNTKKMLTLAATIGTNGQALTPISIPTGMLCKIEILSKEK